MFNKKKKTNTEVNIFNYNLLNAGSSKEEAFIVDNVDVGFIPRVNDGIVIEGEPFTVKAVAYSYDNSTTPVVMVTYAG